MAFSYNFELFPDDKVIIQPYKSLADKNIKDLQERFKTINGSISYLNPDLIISIKHVLIAMNRALTKRQTGAGKGKEVAQLFVNSLIPEKVAKGLNYNFTQIDLSKAGIVVIHLPKDQEVKLKELVKGEEESLENIGVNANFDLIKQVYSIEQNELELDSDIRGSVYNQVALKQLK